MKGQRFRLDRGAVFIVVGSAFLWLCLKTRFVPALRASLFASRRGAASLRLRR